MATWKARDERVERWGCIREAWRNALANSQREEMRKLLYFVVAAGDGICYNTPN